MAQNVFTTKEAFVIGGIAGLLALALTKIGLSLSHATEEPKPVQITPPPSSIPQ